MSHAVLASTTMMFLSEYACGRVRATVRPDPDALAVVSCLGRERDLFSEPFPRSPRARGTTSGRDSRGRVRAAPPGLAEESERGRVHGSVAGLAEKPESLASGSSLLSEVTQPRQRALIVLMGFATGRQRVL